MVTAGEVSPIFAGSRLLRGDRGVPGDVRSAAGPGVDVGADQLVRVTTRPGGVPRRVLVHRAEIMLLHGAWEEAANEVNRACERLAGRPAVGMAYYQQAEVHRLRGEFADAEAAYRQAGQWGREPQPGLAMLRLAQGQVDAATVAIRRVVDEANAAVARSQVLAAVRRDHVGRRGPPVRPASLPMSWRRSRTTSAPRCFTPCPATTTGAVLLGEGDARAAVVMLRRAWAAWRKLDAPYEAARVRVVIGLACRELGDHDAAEIGAATRRARSSVSSAGNGRSRPGRCALADGQDAGSDGADRARGRGAGTSWRRARPTARSQPRWSSASTPSPGTCRTSSAKLGVSSRTAASAFAFEHDLV